MNLWNLKVLGKVVWYLVNDSWESYQVSEKGHYLADPGPQHVGASRRQEFPPKKKKRKKTGISGKYSIIAGKILA